MNGYQSLVANMRSEQSDTQSNSSEVRITVLCTLMHSTNPKSIMNNYALNLKIINRHI
ncbi:hypothetical protein RHMOL_Rhmol09G0084100 [Rhododendron molle]|uniref:Uncharacterized protein n=1 Tax=Rhododendron molle TaxID=49168 RepID=A0ACC0MBC4_RHOML|nr:hypothetical protein RHMOL_Rhmol09G0084100 [Rhododendron molle]